MSTLRVGDLVVLAAEDGSLLSAEPLRRRAAVRPPSSSWPHVGGACVFELCLAHASPESAEVWSRELVRLRHTRSGQLLCASPNTPTTAEADDCLAVSVLPEGELRGAAAVATSCWEVGRASGGHGGIALQAGEQLLLRGAACGLYLRASDGEASGGGAAQRWTLMRYAAAAPARALRADDCVVVELRRGGGEGGGGDDAPRCLAAGVAPSEPVLALEAAEVHAPPPPPPPRGRRRARSRRRAPPSPACCPTRAPRGSSCPTGRRARAPPPPSAAAAAAVWSTSSQAPPSVKRRRSTRAPPPPPSGSPPSAPPAPSAAPSPSPPGRPTTPTAATMTTTTTTLRRWWRAADG